MRRELSLIAIEIGEDGTAQIEADVTFGYEVNAVLSGQEMNEKLAEYNK